MIEMHHKNKNLGVEGYNLLSSKNLFDSLLQHIWFSRLMQGDLGGTATNLKNGNQSNQDIRNFTCKITNSQIF